MTDILTPRDPTQAHDYRPGWMYLDGQQTPLPLAPYKDAMIAAQGAAWLSAGRFNWRPSDETLAQLIVDENAAQAAEAIYHKQYKIYYHVED